MGIANQAVIRQTKNWIKAIVIDLNLCPFAAQPFQNNTIEYIINSGNSLEQHLQQLANSFTKLDASNNIETSLLIYPDAYQTFDDYLELLDFTNHLLDDLNYSGTYQIASFHPDYCFEGSTKNDASNFSNRSPYPMLHLLREKSLEIAIASHPDIEKVPENNIKKLQNIGYEIMSDKLKNITR
ncbi:hypothetical protein MNBD_GAMMA06-829 [hydrothermal vent metagenome]|uniref:DUF1415 domain-containing protein n=1 Tax=hydrothermal vent metagenome TaxID=652676 RepID=A0A3B0WTG4_9ZZZZ